MPFCVEPNRDPTAVYSVCGFDGSIRRSVNACDVEMAVVVFVHVVPPSVDFHTPVLLGAPFAPPPLTATYTMLAFVGLTTICEMVRRLNGVVPTSDHVPPPSVDFSTPR